MSEKIDQVKVFQDDAGEWWLEFYANGIRHQVTIEDVADGLASFVNMQVTNAALHERVNDLESAQPSVQSDFACTCGKCEPLEGNEEFCANTHLPIPQRH